MDGRKVIKIGNSIAVTLPTGEGLVAGDMVSVSKVKNSNTFLVVKLKEE